MLERISALRPDWLSNWLILGITLIFGYYNYATWNFGIFKKLGIKGPRPIPVLGNLLGIQKMGILKFDLEMKRKYGSIVGCFFGKRPNMIIYDIQILKQILIKDFHIFPNRFDIGFFGAPINKMIIFLKDDHWRHIRSILTPTFSSGKMRKMSPQLNHCCEFLCTNLLSRAETGEIFDFRELCGTYTMDVIAQTAFGIEIDSHNDPKNEFVTNATKLFKFKLNGPMLIFMFAPPLYRFIERFFGIGVMKTSITDFFLKVIEGAVKERQQGTTNGQIDFLQLMIAANKDCEDADNHLDKNGGTEKVNKGLTNDELLAQGFLFFLAGFETTANTLSLFIYNMVLYPEIQERLYNEINEKFGDDEEPSYDTIKDLVYLEMCFAETIRMYPAGPRTDRVASKDVTIEGLFIPKDMTIVIPIYALQNDPDYWEEPEVFNPERFAPEVRSKIDPLRYIPFGVGPRNCVGMRFAILELKMAMVQIMRKFKFHSCSETEVPVTFDPMTMRGKNGIKVIVEKRK